MTERMPVRATHLNITRLPEELLIFDLEQKEVHCLNVEAGLVFDGCDGVSPIKEISQQLKDKHGRDDAETYVLGALAAFESKGLLKTEPVSSDRREFLKRSGMAASVAALLITSVVIPEAANAQSITRRRRR